MSGLCFVFIIVVALLFFFFFFQAEDGIRDRTVTGVQTCALPISRPAASVAAGRASTRSEGDGTAAPTPPKRRPRSPRRSRTRAASPGITASPGPEIGRASCRERVGVAGGAGSVKKSGLRAGDERW